MTDPGTALAAAPGDAFYYASRYLPKSARAAVNVIEAGRREIARIPQTCSDRGVAHVKLAWWREELDRVESGEPRHEIGHALVPLARADTALLGAFVTLVDATAASLLEPPLADDAAVHAAVTAQHGPVFDAMQRVCGGGEVATLGALGEIAFELCAFRLHRRGGWLGVSGERLAEHGLTVDDARTSQDRARIAALLAPALEALVERIDAAVGARSRSERRAQRLFVTLARIARRTLVLTLEDGCRVLEHRVAPTPLDKLAIAWRARVAG